MGEATEELDRAREAIQDARVLRDGNGTDAGVVNRLYYATFHAAQGALYALGRNPTSHGHVRQQFGQHLVLKGHATRQEGRLLGELYDLRQEADYGAGVPSVEINEVIENVEQFVEGMMDFVETSERA